MGIVNFSIGMFRDRTVASTTFSAECTPARARLLQRLPAMSEELDRLALESPDGPVLEACESRVI